MTNQVNENLNKEAKIVSLINMKGGVGKTTLTISIAYALATEFDKKVLVIDIDPQFNATQSLLNEFNEEENYLNVYRLNRTVKDIFKSVTSISEQPTKIEANDVILNLNENLDLICGNIDLIFEENTTGKHRRLAKFIRDNSLREVYDLILIDCPPTISFYTDAALITSDYYLIPNRIDRYSILGIKLLNQVIAQLIRDNDLDLKPLGIIYTMVEDQQKINAIKTKFESNPDVKKMKIFNSKTSRNNLFVSGLQGNIASKYESTKYEINAICRELLGTLEEDGDNAK